MVRTASESLARPIQDQQTLQDQAICGLNRHFERGERVGRTWEWVNGGMAECSNG
jgi:hypothetical protein